MISGSVPLSRLTAAIQPTVAGSMPPGPCPRHPERGRATPKRLPAQACNGAKLLLMFCAVLHRSVFTDYVLSYPLSRFLKHITCLSLIFSIAFKIQFRNLEPHLPRYVAREVLHSISWC